MVPVTSRRLRAWATSPAIAAPGIKAADYRDKMAAASKGQGEAPMRDLQLETLAGVLDGEILVHNHCYRGDEMSVMVDIAKEFGYEISSFHHAVEAYKVADLLAEHDICASVWADWWGLQNGGIRRYSRKRRAPRARGCMRDYPLGLLAPDSTPEPGNRESDRGCRTRRHRHPTRARNPLDHEQPQPGRSGILDQTGTLEPGKMADVVVWSG